MMDGFASPPVAPPAVHTKSGTLVVLVAASALGANPDISALLATFKAPRGAVRALLRVFDPRDLTLAATLTQAGIETEVLLPPGIALPAGLAGATALPPGTTIAECDDLALVLSDVLMAAPGAETIAGARDLIARAKGRRKLICPPGCALSCVATEVSSMTHRLDPEVPGWHSKGRRVFGRLEQRILRVLGGEVFAPKRIAKPIPRGVPKPWAPAHYLAPDHWPGVCPDAKLLNDGSPLMTRFKSLDRCALYGSYIHRDLIWAVHLAAGLAVFFAVGGAVFARTEWLSVISTLAELALLLFIASAVLASRFTRLHGRWIACRMGAEQLRIACMCLSFLVVPRALTTVASSRTAAGGRAADFTDRVLAEVRRAVRDHGLPRLPPDYTPIQAAKWLQVFVDDQARYHAQNSAKLECAETRLNRITGAIFALALVAVLAVVTRVVGHLPALLFLTAGGPAIAAALHGAETRLGIMHRAGLSEEVHHLLKPISDDLAKFLAKPPTSAETEWRHVRAWARQAAEAMSEENRSWHRLLRREQDNLPA